MGRAKHIKGFNEAMAESFLPVSQFNQKNSNTLSSSSAILSGLGKAFSFITQLSAAKSKRRISFDSTSSNASAQSGMRQVDLDDSISSTPTDSPVFDIKKVLTADILRCCTQFSTILDLIPHASQILKDGLIRIIGSLATDKGLFYPAEKMEEKAIPGLARVRDHIAEILPDFCQPLKEIEISSLNVEFEKLDLELKAIILKLFPTKLNEVAELEHSSLSPVPR